MSDLAITLAFALVFGLLAARLKLQPIVGYLVAGALCGPYTPGFVSDVRTAEQLGEIGVVFLMFGVGLHFSVRDLMAVRKTALLGALGQSAIATILTIGMAGLFGWGLGAGLVLGLALSVASTVVLVKTLLARNALETRGGQVAVGWLIVEDLFSAFVLVLLPLLATSLGGHPSAEHAATGSGLLDALLTEGDSVLGYAARLMELPETMPLLSGITFVNAVLLVAALPLGRCVLGWLYRRVLSTRSDELLTLAIVVTALFIAFTTSAVFGLSVALGAFFAGLVISGSPTAHRVAEDVRPLRDMFGVLFFASVGMLFDPMTVLRAPVQIVLVLLVIMVAKPLTAALITRALGETRETVFIVSPALGQIGEFSFILASIGRATGLLPAEAFQLIVTGAILSIALNPLLFLAADRMKGTRRALEREA